MAEHPVAAAVGLRTLGRSPFDLLRELERRARAAVAGLGAGAGSVEEWVGVGFRLGPEQFVISRDDVREVLMVPPAVTRVPGAKGWLKGLANVRGHLLPIADLREFLGSKPQPGDRTSRVLVANSHELPVGLVVDEVFGFRRFLERERGDDVPTLKVSGERFLAGSFRRAGECWPIFSLGRLLEDQDFQRAAADPVVDAVANPVLGENAR